MRVETSWAVITGYLRERCPDALAEVLPPATAAQLHRAEQAVGGPLPDELLRWWRLACGMDGFTSLFPQTHSPASVPAALDNRSVWQRAGHYALDDYATCAAAPAGTPCDGWWLPQWLPVARDIGGACLFVDLRPGVLHGCVGEYTKDRRRFDRPLWAGVGDMLADTAAAMQIGKRVRGLQIQADDYGIEWCW